eukprot:TRINITY_DN699_c0_g1_i1.p1 TRINITY_DN699_c0_g1~~TRINITY_DN699_c0_g1_i1.p1  ORF type:complete len:293 (+),score=64.76 TRINITY_DN699_c0_g1_i1:32-880(+)
MSKRKRLEPPDIRRRKKARVAVSSLEVMMSLGFDRNGRMTEAQADFTGTRDSGDDEPRTPTHSAILSLRSYLVDLNVDVLQLPFVFFQSQIYYFIPDRTTVDVELNALKAAGTMRVFKMISTTNEHSIMLTTDYLDLIEQQSLFFLKQHPHLRIFGLFADVVSLHNEVSITKKRLTSLLGTSATGELKYLIQGGLLLHRDVNSYWFAIPGAGVSYKIMNDSRKKIRTMMRRYPFNETFLEDFKKKKLSVSPFGIEFHLYDCVGVGLLKKVESPGGDLVQLGL